MTITQRIDNITRIPPDYYQTELPAPKSVKIELTGLCNYKCAFCARSQQLRQQKEMDRSLFERLLLDMREAGVEEIGLFYLGESFMCQWLEDAIHFAKHVAKFPYVFLTTNGSLCTPQRLEQCFRNGLDSLKFSLNYSDEDQFVEIAQVKRKLFHTMVANIKAARAVRDKVEAETGQHCGLYGSYIAYDGEQGQRMAQMLAEMQPYLDETYALPLYNQADFVSAEEHKRGWTASAGNRGRLENLRDPIPCWAVFTEGHITWDGKLSACCFDHDGRFHMGDLTTTPFMQAWNSDAFKALRQAHLNKDVTGTVCEKCVVYN